MRTDPRPTPDALAHYYPRDYAPYRDTRVTQDTGLPSPRPWWKRLAWTLLAPDGRMVPKMKPGRLLEIGCASGAFLHQFASRGWQVDGLEFSDEAGGAARALGYPVHVGTLEDAPDPEHRYDLVTGWHTVEHLAQPLHGLAKLARWTRRGGWLAVSVPDAGSWEFAVFRDAWYGLSLPVHLYHFTSHTASHLLEAAGWAVRRVFWHNSAVNLMQSLRYRSLDRGWERTAAYLHDIAEGRRHQHLRLALGRLLGILHASGRMTIWAQRT